MKYIQDLLERGYIRWSAQSLYEKGRNIMFTLWFCGLFYVYPLKIASVSTSILLMNFFPTMTWPGLIPLLISPITLVYDTIKNNPQNIIQLLTSAGFISQVSLISAIPLLYKAYNSGFFSYIKEIIAPSFNKEIYTELKNIKANVDIHGSLINAAIIPKLDAMQKQIVLVHIQLQQAMTLTQNDTIDALKVINTTVTNIEKEISSLKVSSTVNENNIEEENNLDSRGSLIIHEEVRNTGIVPISIINNIASLENNSELDKFKTNYLARENTTIEILNTHLNLVERVNTISEEAQRQYIKQKATEIFQQSLTPDPLQDRFLSALKRITISTVLVQGIFLGTKYYLGDEAMLSSINSLTFGATVALPLALSNYWTFNGAPNTLTSVLPAIEAPKAESNTSEKQISNASSLKERTHFWRNFLPNADNRGSLRSAEEIRRQFMVKPEVRGSNIGTIPIQEVAPSLSYKELAQISIT